MQNRTKQSVLLHTVHIISRVQRVYRLILLVQRAWRLILLHNGFSWNLNLEVQNGGKCRQLLWSTRAAAAYDKVAIESFEWSEDNEIRCPTSFEFEIQNAQTTGYETCEIDCSSSKSGNLSISVLHSLHVCNLLLYHDQAHFNHYPTLHKYTY